MTEGAERAPQVRQLRQVYLDRSQMLDLAACRARSAFEHFAEDAARLVGPVLLFEQSIDREKR